MKAIFTFLYLLLISACGSGKENVYTGSTPANAVVKSFLGIPLSDSIDFIRWNLILRDNGYQLECNYGISKPNTNGFISDGQKVGWKGMVTKEKNYYQLHHEGKILKLLELNADLLYLLDDNKNILVGNGGWSYTLNNVKPAGSDQINIIGKKTVLQDSMVFDGRTPCKVPGVIAPGTQCYKLKWRVILYVDSEKNEPSDYKIVGTVWRKTNGKAGTWKIINGKDGRIVYQLNDEAENGILYLLNLDDNILVFTDASGKLLVGDEDFSYTLNRKNK